MNSANIELFQLQICASNYYRSHTEIEPTDIIIPSFASIKEIINKNIIPFPKINLDRFYNFLNLDCLFLGEELKSNIFTYEGSLKLELYPNYNVYAYEFNNIFVDYDMETRRDFLNIVNTNKLSIHDKKILVLQLYGCTRVMYFKKNVSIENELYSVCSKFIKVNRIQSDIDLDTFLETAMDIDDIDRNILIHDTKLNKSTNGYDILYITLTEDIDEINKK